MEVTRANAVLEASRTETSSGGLSQRREGLSQRREGALGKPPPRVRNPNFSLRDASALGGLHKEGLREVAPAPEYEHPSQRSAPTARRVRGPATPPVTAAAAAPRGAQPSPAAGEGEPGHLRRAAPRRFSPEAKGASHQRADGGAPAPVAFPLTSPPFPRGRPPPSPPLPGDHLPASPCPASLPPGPPALTPRAAGAAR